MKEMKIKKISIYFKNLKMGCTFESLYLEKKTTTLPYIGFGFKCVVMYLRCQKGRLEKNLNKFSLAADLLKYTMWFKRYEHLHQKSSTGQNDAW